MLALSGPENTMSRGLVLRIRPKQVTVTELGASRAKARVGHSSSGVFAYTASKAGRVLCSNCLRSYNNSETKYQSNKIVVKIDYKPHH